MTKLDIAFLERFARHGPVGKTLGMLVRTAFVAPPGKTFVWGDWSAIEARVLPWLAASPGAERVLDIFRTNDKDSSLPDIYEITAGKLLGKPSSEVTKKERQSHGKVPTLSLGFGGGLGALQAMAVNYRVYFDAESGKALVEGWRADNAWAPEFWGKFRTHQEDGSVIESSGLWGAVHMALRNPGTPYTAGRVAYVYDPAYLSGTLFCALPDSRLLTYPDIKVRTKVVKDKITGEETEKTALWYRKGYGWSALWHGKCAENVTQAVAGSILRETLDDLELAPEVKLGLWETIGHTHDEALIMADDAPDTVAAARAHLESEMLRPREWRLDLPLAVEVTDNWYYTKSPDTDDKFRGD